MGFSALDFDMTLQYIEHEAPVIIQFKDDVAQYFVDKDSQYKNQRDTTMAKV